MVRVAFLLTRVWHELKWAQTESYIGLTLTHSWRPGWRPGRLPAHHPVQALRFIRRLQPQQRKRRLLHRHLLQVPLRAPGGWVVRDIDPCVATRQPAFGQHKSGGFSTPREKKGSACFQPQDWGTDYFCGVFPRPLERLEMSVISYGRESQQWYCDGIVIHCEMFGVFCLLFLFFYIAKLCNTFGASHKWALSTT